MKRYDWHQFNMKSIEDQLDFLIEKKIFFIRDNFGRANLYKISELSPKQIIDENCDDFYNILELIVTKERFSPTKLYLDHLFNLMVKQYEEDKDKIDYNLIFEKFQQNFSYTNILEDKIKLIDKYKFKIIKKITKYPPPFLMFGKIIKEKLIEDLKFYWHSTPILLPDEIDPINRDVLYYATSGDSANEDMFEDDDFDCRYLSTYNDLLYITSLLNIVEYLDDLKFKILNNIDIESKNIKYNIQYVLSDYNRYPELFKTSYGCELYFYLISKTKKTTSRTFTILWNIFQICGLVENYHGIDTEFQNFIKVEFKKTITRIEKDFNRPIEKETNNFKKDKVLFDKLLKAQGYTLFPNLKLF